MATLEVDNEWALAPAGRKVAAELGEQDWIADYYLAGSAALALYIGHRPVHDLDLMSPVQRLRANERRDLLQELIARDSTTQVETARDGFLYVRLRQQVGVRFFYYPYPLIAPESNLGQLPVASAIDLGLMKLGAIISRGNRRDFVDLYLLCQRVPLGELLDSAADKFGHVRDFPLQALKGLADLSQVESEPMPVLRRALDWEQVQAWLDDEVRSLTSERIGRA